MGKINAKEKFQEIMRTACDESHLTESQKMVNESTYYAVKSAATLYNQNNIEQGFSTCPIMFGFINPTNTLIDYFESSSWEGFERGFRYKKNISKKYVTQLNDLITNFDMSYMTPIIVWYDKKAKAFRVLDGGHRVVVCTFLKVGNMPFMCVDFPTYDAAKSWYNNQYKNCTRLSSTEQLIGDIAAGDKDGLAIKRWLINNKWGLKGIYEDPNGNNIGCIATIKRINSDYGEAGLNYCSTFIKKAIKPLDPKRLNVKVFKMCHAIYPLVKDHPEKNLLAMNKVKEYPSFTDFDAHAKTYANYLKAMQNDEGYVIGYMRALLGDLKLPEDVVL